MIHFCVFIIGCLVGFLGSVFFASFCSSFDKRITFISRKEADDLEAKVWYFRNSADHWYFLAEQRREEL